MGRISCCVGACSGGCLAYVSWQFPLDGLQRITECFNVSSSGRPIWRHVPQARPSPSPFMATFAYQIHSGNRDSIEKTGPIIVRIGARKISRAVDKARHHVENLIFHRNDIHPVFVRLPHSTMRKQASSTQRASCETIQSDECRGP